MDDRMTKTRCETCRFWDKEEAMGSGLYIESFCHRFPSPVLKRSCAWCGEHQSRQEGGDSNHIPDAGKKVQP